MISRKTSMWIKKKRDSKTDCVYVCTYKSSFNDFKSINHLRKVMKTFPLQVWRAAHPHTPLVGQRLNTYVMDYADKAAMGEMGGEKGSYG